MKHFKTTFLSLSILGLVSCGGGDKLAFKNADTVIKSYNDIIADMTEADRQTFSRNMILVLRDDETPIEELNINSWNRATQQASDLAYLSQDHPSVKQFAGELALTGVKSLDGKTASYVNKRGAEIRALALNGEITKAQEELEKFNTVLTVFDTDRASHKAAYDKVIAREKELSTKMAIYKPTATATKFSNNYRGDSLEGTMSMFNPHEDDIWDTRVHIHAKYKGHTARYRLNLNEFNRKPKAGQSHTSKFSLLLQPSSFVNENGEKLPRDEAMPKDISAYELTMRPIWVRTSSKKNGWVERDNNLTDEEISVLNSYGTKVAQCDRDETNLKNLIASYEKRIESIKADKLDELQYISASYREGCK